MGTKTPSRCFQPENMSQRRYTVCVMAPCRSTSALLVSSVNRLPQVVTNIDTAKVAGEQVHSKIEGTEQEDYDKCRYLG